MRPLFPAPNPAETDPQSPRCEQAEFGLLEDDARDSWGTVADLDVFFTHMYKYFYHKGLPSVILTAVCNLM